MITNRRLATSGIDDYYTPTWVTNALLEKETFRGLIWEPACGDGWISKAIKRHSYHVVSSDLATNGNYGAGGIDFLSTNFRAANIITNPPYGLLLPFMEHGLKLVRRKFCLFIRLSALAGIKRWNLVYSQHPPTRVYVLCERATLYRRGRHTGGSGTTEYAWFVWSKDEDNNENRRTELYWVMPGSRARDTTSSRRIGEN